MRAFAVHDEAGNITGLAIPADGVEEGEFGLVAEPGQYVSEIDVPETHGRQPDERLRDLPLNYRIDRSANPARLKGKRA